MATTPKKKPTHDRTKKNFADPNNHRDNFKILGRNEDGIAVELTKTVDQGGPRGVRQTTTFVFAEKDIPALKAALDNAQPIG